MEKTSMKLELARYITQWSSIEHRWGETDCMMFIFCWHDVRFGTNKNLSLYRKYNSYAEATRFGRNFVTIKSWLASNSYKELTAKKPKLKDGDIVVVRKKHLYDALLVFNNSLYTMDEERGLIRLNPSLLDYDSVWRQA
jgi:hypothetical protein|tara:strand:- start:1509 stop:1925 length:417 start_codon:yes stop_codon:yes gene_type:complete